MKKLLISAVLGAATLIANGAAYIPVQGNYIDGTTNTQVVAGTNATVGTVIAASTNFYNLPGVTYNTNSWPSQPLVPPNNTIPWRYIGIQAQTTTNLGDKLIFRYAASCDNSHWTSNMFTFAASAGAAPNISTNLDALGFPFWSLQAIENAGASNVVGILHVPVVKATAP